MGGIISAIVVFIILGSMQLFIPDVTAMIGNNGTPILCWEQVDLLALTTSKWCEESGLCNPIKCPSQGPFSIFWQANLHPWLYLNGVLGIGYHLFSTLL